MNDEAKLMKALDPFLGVIRTDISSAVDFVTSQYAEENDKSDRYYNGEVDLETSPGRSGVVSTQVRDAIRNLRPSIMRILCGNREGIISYRPSALQYAPVIEQQSKYVHQLFWKSDGYVVLYQMVDESLRHKFGPVKTYWEENPIPEYVEVTGLTMTEVQAFSDMPNVEILAIYDDTAESAATSTSALPVNGDANRADFTVEAVRTKQNGQIKLQAVPYGEFFISQNARGTADARVHGHRRVITVAEAEAMGLTYDDWEGISSPDAESAATGDLSAAKRGHANTSEIPRGDPLSRSVLITEAYVNIDLLGLDYPQLYCVYLGGIGYELLSIERISESPFDICVHDIRTFSPIGYSVADVTTHSQDVITSLLRGMVDNVHAANRPRIAASPQQVNFDDLMNHAIGHPLRLKTGAAPIQVVAIPSQIQSTLPMLAWLEQDAQNKVGVTKAAQGLDPGAMQSTDKAAVQNTIQLSQGQTELAVRNIIETALIPMFRKMLNLSIRHMDRDQIVMSQGMYIPVNQLAFDASCYAEPRVGLGTPSQEQRMMGLQATLQQQMGIMSMLGANNPFVTASLIYNTIEDLTAGYGLDNVGRYFNQVTPEKEAAYAQQKAQEQQQQSQQAQPVDPSTALLQAEQMKLEQRSKETMIKAHVDLSAQQLDALKYNADDDFRRDQMAQDRVIESAKIVKGLADQAVIMAEQNTARKGPMPSDGASPSTGTQSAGDAGSLSPVSPADQFSGLVQHKAQLQLANQVAHQMTDPVPVS